MSDDRTPPTRIRITGLQEAQLQELVQLDALASKRYHEIGFDTAEVPERNLAALVALTRDHNVHVAEADHVPAGFLAWRDESPGVAYLADVEVHPDYQRFGVASKLLQALKAEARGLRLEHIVVRCWSKATWAMGFYKAHGFAPIDDAAPAKVRGWRDERRPPVTRPGEVALWVAVGLPPEDSSEAPESD